MIKIRLQQMIVALLIYIAPSLIFIWRHIDLTLRETVSITPYILAGLIVGIGAYFLLKDKNKKMKIRETKENEDNKRTAGTILYFYSKFIVIFIVIFLILYYVQFNFKSLTTTMEMIGGVMALGGVLRINLAIKTGY